MLKPVFIFCFLLSCLTMAAQGAFSRHSGEVKDGYDFILYEPEGDAKPMPLVIALHSRSAAGRDLEIVDHFGTIDALHSGMPLNAMVLAPLATGDRWEADKIMKDLESVIANHDVDSNRIYAIGMSMGGNGVADLCMTYPDRIAAAIVLAASASDDDVANLNKVPLWVIRGLKDRPEAIDRTKQMVEVMRAQEDKAPRLVYTEVEGLDHRGHERILYIPAFYEWLLSHDLSNPNRSVNTTFDITEKSLKNAYKGLHLRKHSAAKRKPHHRRNRLF